GVDGDGPAAARESGGGLVERSAVSDDRRQPVRRPQQRDRRRGVRVFVLECFSCQRMTPARIANATIWARSPVPSLRPMRERWLFTVSAERLSASPISLLDCPSATSCSTSTSRAESSRGVLSVPGTRVPVASSGATVGSAYTPPSSTRLTPSVTIAADADLSRYACAPDWNAERTAYGSSDESSTTRR